ncbi:hypothetical protein [Xanthomonas sp. MLO165]|uniref:hypothetical protein n=1 Tax=Xanthomonas sp. MLO165 TaxID=2081477 RepID=UPI001C042280|nr:hypothetical protein [Xanthomonas sp. MLO165]
MSQHNEETKAELKAELITFFTSGIRPDINELDDAYFDEILEQSLVRDPPSIETDLGNHATAPKGPKNR